MNVSPINFQTGVTNQNHVNFGHRVITPEIYDDFVKNGISYSESYAKGYRYMTRDVVTKVLEKYVNVLKASLEKHPDNALIKKHIEQVESKLCKIHTEPFIQELTSPEKLEACFKI